MSGLTIKIMKQPNRIINYWLKEKTIVICILFFGITFNCGMILGPIYQGKLIDSIIAKSSLSSSIRLAAAFVLLILVVQILRYYKRFYIRRFANSTSASMRLMIYNNIMHQTTAELQKESIGDLMTKAVSDVELCVEGMRKFTTEVFDTGVLLAAYIITMLVYDLRTTLLSALFVPAAMFLADKLKSFIYHYSISYRKKSSEITQITYDLIDNAMFYRVNGMDSENKINYENHLTDLQKKAVKANILENSMQPVYNGIAMAGSLIVIYLGGRKVIDGAWTVGMFSTYITIFIAMAGKASKASKLFNSVQKSQVSWKRIKPYLTEYQRKDNTCSINSNSTSLKVSNLCQSFQADREPIINNISFDARQGEIVGITGPIACGKSTLGLTLTGLFPYMGSILLDGKKLSEYNEFERSCLISYLGHKPELLSDTIYQNITMGKDQDISAVLKDVCFDEDILLMPEGINTLVGNSGIRLSGGQQARIALARALLNKNKIIILDDPFSAVDMKTEKLIIRNLKEHYKGSIILLISHRLAIFGTIDKILLLHQDKTVEYGTHKELMNRSRLYESIYQLQNREGEDKDEA